MPNAWLNEHKSTAAMNYFLNLPPKNPQIIIIIVMVQQSPSFKVPPTKGLQQSPSFKVPPTKGLQQSPSFKVPPTKGHSPY